MPDTNSLLFNSPGLRSPSLLRQIAGEAAGASAFQKLDSSLLVGTSLGNSGSFKYDLDGNGIKSTQQLNVDWSQFANHTFFNSAQVKTNVAFDKVFNQFPFDGTLSELELFLDGLTGFEKYVFDQFPKNVGYLFFSGTVASEVSGGTYVTVKDQAGTNVPTVSRNLTAHSILNPVSNSMCLEFHLFVPSGSNTDQYVMYKATSALKGFAISLNSTGSTSQGLLTAGIFSGSSFTIETDALITKGQFNHVAFVWDRSSNVNALFAYVNQVLVSSSSHQELGYLDMDSADLIIGSGSTISGFLTPQTTFSGAMDELRIWHRIPGGDERAQNERKTIFAQEDLQLYFKFNEPSGSFSRIVLDSSSNSVHGILSQTGYDLGVRDIPTGSIAGVSPMTYEKLSIAPVLFPEYVGVQTLQTTLLSSASIYDLANPNLITKLIPKHYLIEGQFQDGLVTEEGAIVDQTINNSDPQSVQMGNTQVLLLLLYTWAKFFDEMKLYIQSFSHLYHLDYDSTDTVPDKFLQFYADRFGYKLPPLFTGATIPQFIDAENVDDTISTNQYSLQYVQNQIWRRILINLKDVVQSKGTIHSVKSFLRAVGIDPDNNFRIREFGGPNKKSLANARENHTKISTLLDFVSGGFIYSPYLSGSRVELGYPQPIGTISPGGASNNPSDGLFTSGSWTYEGIYKFVSGSTFAQTQSLMRLSTTGTLTPAEGSLVANLVFYRGGPIRLYAVPNSSSATVLSMSLTGADLFDGNVWNVSCGRYRADSVSSSVSSSYFIRASTQTFGAIDTHAVTASWFDEGAITYPNNIIWSNVTASLNASGAFLTVGSQSITLGTTFLNNSTLGSDTRATDFTGRVGHMRFWSKALDLVEWDEHVRNFRSLGVQNPLTNFNFNTYPTGAFERLRVEVSTDQANLETDVTGGIRLTDFSQNVLDFHGSGFPITSSVIVGQRFDYSLISPKFDVAATTDKVRVRGFLSFENVLSSSYAEVAPAYEVPRTEMPTDNTRFTIDFSIVDALDQDIMNIFSTLDTLDNIIGNPEYVFSPDYPKLDALRFIYFNRLTTKVNLKSFFDFYKWFDTNIGTFIAQLVPRKTKFLGTNFVIESHMLERPKMEYLFSDIYLGDSERHHQKDTILLQQFVGTIKRY